MRRNLQPLRDGPFDLLVVGAGINGAGAARDAAMRGLRVALVDKGDFGSGTSSRSSKLVHGGIRYLEQLDFGLVRQASRERGVLQRIAPHLVRPLPFLIPVYRGDRRNLNLIRLGTWLYDALALFRNTHNHRILSPEETLRLEPAMRSAGLRGAALYYDAQMDDARLCLANVISAVEHGAVAANYVELTGIDKENGQVAGARLRDCLTGETFAPRTARVLNTAGPWLDAVCSFDRPQPPKLRLTKGTHIFVPPLTRQYAITIPASDGRVIFVIPWGSMSLVGTTDTDFDGDPGTVHPTQDEVDYLLKEVRRIIPAHTLSADAVISAYAGVRSLIHEEGVSEGQVSREHRIYESPSGVTSLAGGKYTTYRDVARQLVDRLSSQPCRTHLEPLPGGDLADFDGYAREQAPELMERFGLELGGALRLTHAYGSRAAAVMQAAPGRAEIEARTVHAVQEEMAITLTDVLRRRTQIAFGPGSGVPLADPVSRVMAPLLRWDELERRRQVQEFAASVGVLPAVAVAG